MEYNNTILLLWNKTIFSTEVYFAMVSETSKLLSDSTLIILAMAIELMNVHIRVGYILFLFFKEPSTRSL